MFKIAPQSARTCHIFSPRPNGIEAAAGIMIAGLRIGLASPLNWRHAFSFA